MLASRFKCLYFPEKEEKGQEKGEKGDQKKKGKKKGGDCFSIRLARIWMAVPFFNLNVVVVFLKKSAIIDSSLFRPHCSILAHLGGKIWRKRFKSWREGSLFFPL